MGLCGPSKQARKPELAKQPTSAPQEALAAQVAAPGVTKSEVEATDPADRAAEVPSQNKTFPTTTAAAAAEGGRGAAAAQADRRAGTEEPHVAIFDLAAAQTQEPQGPTPTVSPERTTPVASGWKPVVGAKGSTRGTATSTHSSPRPSPPSTPPRSKPDAMSETPPVPGAAPEELTIVLPQRRAPVTFKAPPSLSAITPGRSLTASVLGRGPTQNVKDVYTLGKKLGAGQYGTAYLCVEKATGETYACKTIPRSSLISEEDVEDVRTEVGIMYRLAGQPNVVKIRGTYEDRYYVHIVMELCSGGELFDHINARMAKSSVPYSERDAAALAKHIVRAIDVCHRLGVVHRDLKPENFLFTSRSDDAVLKVTDFGMAALFRPGQKFDRACGSAMYMAPEVVRLWRRRAGPKVGYGPEVDIFGAGVIMFILLVGEHPFPPPPHERSDSGYMRAILRGRPSFGSPEWKKISMAARELITSMLCLDPKGRPTAAQVLSSAWIREAPDEPLDLTVVRRFKHFIDLVMLKRIKKVAMRAMAETLSEAEVACVRQLVADADAPPRKTGLMSVELLFSVLQAVGADKAAAEVAKVFEETGVSKTASFEYAGFLEATAALAQIAQQENLFKGLSLFDEDLSGYITEDELKRACAQFRVDEKSMRELILEVNRDDTGRIDYNEFVAMMRKETGGLGRKIVEGNSDLSLKEMQEAAESMVVDS